MDKDFQNWPSRYITREDMGEEWPLSIDAITLHYKYPCLVAEVGGIFYAVNGSAKGHLKILDIDDIWASHSHSPRKNIGPLIQLGLAIEPVQ